MSCLSGGDRAGRVHLIGRVLGLAATVIIELYAGDSHVLDCNGLVTGTCERWMKVRGWKVLQLRRRLLRKGGVTYETAQY